MRAYQSPVCQMPAQVPALSAQYTLALRPANLLKVGSLLLVTKAALSLT